MKKEVYKEFWIELNNYGEYCVGLLDRDNMISYNAGFDSIGDAKSFIDEITEDNTLLNLTKEDIEKIANTYKNN